MKKILVVFVLLMAVFTGLAFANGKIAVFNMQKALDESLAGKDAVESMKKEYQALQKDIDTKSMELKKMQDELNAQSAILSEDAKQAKMDDYQKKLKSLQTTIKDANDDFKKKEQMLVNKIANELRDVVEKLGKELGYSVIFEKREAGVLYNADASDITNLVVERYDKEWKTRKK
ncbi:MAG: OmpH family outer membrane protein [Calditerrivibrio sp.]|nr:OmpH family outer membrane protein [Calditerrivibrio sp.]